MNLLMTIDNITKLLQLGAEFDLCYVDFSIVFDAIIHHMACATLESLEVHLKGVTWMTTFLVSRSLRVKLKSKCLPQ